MIPSTSVTPAMVAAAAGRIRPHVRRTPLWVAEPLSERVGATVVVKAEHSQITGSFKLRGALNKVLSLPASERAAGIVTASSGNHGIAVATAAGIVDAPCTVFLPRGASPAKVSAIGRLGASIVAVDSVDAFDAEVAARAASETSGSTYVSPYNDVEVMAGQGTVGVEIVDDVVGAGLGQVDAVVAAVGGGGLLSGLATWVTERWPDVEIVGASPANDAAMVASIGAGAIIEAPAEPTFSDGTAGGIEPGAITFEACQRLVGTWLTVAETDLARAVVAMIDDHHQLVEGAAGVALAAAAEWARTHPGSTVVVVSCGANVSSTTLARILGVGVD